MKELKYSVHVYEDHAIIKGGHPPEVLDLLITVSKQEGFNYVMAPDDGTQGFKLVRK